MAKLQSVQVLIQLVKTVSCILSTIKRAPKTGLSSLLSINKDMGVKISDLPTATQPFSGSDEIPLVQDGETRRATLTSLTDYLSVTKVNVDALSGNYLFTNQDSGKIKTTSLGTSITAWISQDINLPGFNTSVAQLSTGTVTIALSSSYTAGALISYGNLYQTAGQGAIANILRASNNTFLLTGLLQ